MLEKEQNNLAKKAVIMVNMMRITAPPSAQKGAIHRKE